MKPVDNNLSERYNDGLVPPPDLAGEPARLLRPVWQPTPAQVQVANGRLVWSIAALALLICACLAMLVLASGWIQA